MLISKRGETANCYSGIGFNRYLLNLEYVSTVTSNKFSMVRLNRIIYESQYSSGAEQQN
jgi:hypothetical protein